MSAVLKPASSLAQKIVEDAKAEAGRIVREAEDFMKSLTARRKREGREKGGAEAKQIIESARADAQRIRRSKLSSAKVRSNWMMLMAKEEIIKKTMSLVVEELKKYVASDEYTAYLSKTIEELCVALGAEEVEVLLNEDDLKRGVDVSSISKNVSDRLGKPVRIVVKGERISNIGGVIVRTADGRVAINNTFEEIIARREREIRLAIAQELLR